MTVITTVVCDVGGGLVKCGFAGASAPAAVFPSVVARQAKEAGSVVVVGDAALAAAAAATSSPGTSYSSSTPAATGAAEHQPFQLSYPIQAGVVTDWGDVGAMYGHAVRNCLRVDPSSARLLLTERGIVGNNTQRRRALEMAFETLGFSAATVQLQAVLGLYMQGLVTGVVLDSGDGISQAVAIVDGFAFSSSARSLGVAGRQVTARLLELLRARGYALDATRDMLAVQTAKESLCYTAVDYQKELKVARETTCLLQSYTLPDGRTIRAGPERFMAPEVLFNPQLVDVEAPGIAEMAFNVINEVDVDNRRKLYEHIVLGGGSSMFPGLTTRMDRELRALYLHRIAKGDKATLSKLSIRVEDSPMRKNMAFVGAAILADIMQDHPEFWVTRQEWQEDPHRALKKFG